MGLQRRTRDIIELSVDNLTDFHRGNVWAEHIKKGHTSTFGKLPQFWTKELNSDITDNDVYVVYSYQTPIAWFNGRVWITPDEHYSNTTTHHQSAVNVAIHKSWKKLD